MIIDTTSQCFLYTVRLPGGTIGRERLESVWATCEAYAIQIASRHFGVPKVWVKVIRKQ